MLSIRVDYLDIRVQIKDQNDNPPQFSAPQYYVTIRENLDQSTVVIRVHATDLDHEAELTFRTVKFTPSLCSDWFTLDSRSGRINVTGKVDYDVMVTGDNCVILVEVSDGIAQDLTEVNI